MLVEDETAYRESLHKALTSVPGLEIIDEAVLLALKLQPDVILMDISMKRGRLDGIQATEQIIQTSPSIKVLMLTMLQDDLSIFNSMRVGARGYLLKGADRDRIVQAIEIVSYDGLIFDPGVAQHVLDYFAKLTQARPVELLPELTDREREILDLMAKGLEYDTISERLNITFKTVKNHVQNIFAKLQVANRTQAVIRALRAGLG